MPPDPVFGSEDRVPGGGGGGDTLPAELVGKTPAQIAKFFQDRETALRAELDRRPASVTPPAEPPGPSNTEFWNDPNKSVERVVAAKALSRAEFDQLAGTIRQQIIWTAKRMVSEKHSDFHRIEKEIDEIMKNVPEHAKIDPSMWETVYVQAKGLAHDRLSAEDRANPTLIGEPGNPGGVAPAADADLYKVTAPGVSQGTTIKSAGHVADHLGVSHDGYRKAAKILNEGDGLLPLTVDTRRSK
jgi:hypothetical protein